MFSLQALSKILHLTAKQKCYIQELQENMPYECALGKDPAMLTAQKCFSLPLSLSRLRSNDQSNYKQPSVWVGVTFHHDKVTVYGNFLSESNILLVAVYNGVLLTIL